jgi:hypothetical protein
MFLNEFLDRLQVDHDNPNKVLAKAGVQARSTWNSATRIDPGFHVEHCSLKRYGAGPVDPRTTSLTGSSTGEYVRPAKRASK